MLKMWEYAKKERFPAAQNIMSIVEDDGQTNEIYTNIRVGEFYTKEVSFHIAIFQHVIGWESTEEEMKA